MAWLSSKWLSSAGSAILSRAVASLTSQSRYMWLLRVQGGAEYDGTNLTTSATWEPTHPLPNDNPRELLELDRPLERPLTEEPLLAVKIIRYIALVEDS